jgi:uncharacterized membrane protein
MRPTLAALSAAVAAPFLSSPSFAAGPAFSGLGILPGGTSSSVQGISADGSTAVGYSFVGGENLPVRWSIATGLRALDPLPASNGSGNIARQVSADGNVIVGFSRGRAFRWTNTGGPNGTTTDLGTLQPSNEGFSNAWGVSDDGDTVIGTAQNTSAFNVFRWTSTVGMISQGLFDASALSPDGQWFTATNPTGGGSFETLRSDGVTTEVIDAIEGVENPSRSCNAISRFGNHVVGNGVVVFPSGLQIDQAFLWSHATGITSALPDLPGGLGSCAALDLSDDASTIVGWGSASNGRQATIWLNGLPQTVASYLTRNGVTGFTGWRLTSATAVTPDGLTIAGEGINPQGRNEGWIATIPAPGTTWALMLAGMSAARRTRCPR